MSDTDTGILPTNVGLCVISTDVLHKLLRLPATVRILAIRQSSPDWFHDRFRIAIEAEEFAIMDTPMNPDGTRAEVPHVLPIYKQGRDNRSRFAGWKVLDKEEESQPDDNEYDNYHQW